MKILVINGPNLLLLGAGAPEQARQALEELVLKFPGDMFSEKARIALLRLQNKI